MYKDLKKGWGWVVLIGGIMVGWGPVGSCIMERFVAKNFQILACSNVNKVAGKYCVEIQAKCIFNSV